MGTDAQKIPKGEKEGDAVPGLWFPTLQHVLDSESLPKVLSFFYWVN